MPNPSYTPPLEQLLTLGSAWGSQPWPDYLALGIGREHNPRADPYGDG